MATKRNLRKRTRKNKMRRSRRYRKVSVGGGFSVGNKVNYKNQNEYTIINKNDNGTYNLEIDDKTYDTIKTKIAEQNSKRTYGYTNLISVDPHYASYSTAPDPIKVPDKTIQNVNDSELKLIPIINRKSVIRHNEVANRINQLKGI